MMVDLPWRGGPIKTMLNAEVYWLGSNLSIMSKPSSWTSDRLGGLGADDDG